MTEQQTRPQPALTKIQESLAEVIEPVSKLDLVTLASVMVQSGMFPDLTSMSQGVVKILAGRELGFPPIASLRHIYVRNGHIGLMAALIAAKIRQSRQYDYRVVEHTDQKCLIEFSRLNKTGQWQVEGEAKFSLEEAKTAGLVKAGSGWTSWPSDMLFARAITRGQRRFAPDVFGGQVVYSKEELSDPGFEAASTESAESYRDMMPREREQDARGEVIDLADHRGVDRQEDREETDPDSESRPAPAATQAPSASPTPPPPAAAAPVAPGVPKGDVRASVSGGDHRVTTFTLNGVPYRTAGVGEKNFLQILKTCAKVDKAKGPKYSANLLLKEFDVQTRVDLTEEMAERFLVRLNEVLES